MNDKNIIARFGLIFALLFALASCEKHEYLHLPDGPDGTPIENPGRLHLAGIPEVHTAMLLDPAQGNRLVATVSARQPVDVEEGTYTLLYISPADGEEGGAGTPSHSGYSLDGLTLSLPLLSADGLLPQLPDIHTDAITINIRRENTHTVSFNPAPHTRAVQMDVQLQGAEMSNIRSIEARLYGVNRTSQLDRGFAPLTRNAEEGAGSEVDARDAAQVYYHSSPLTAASGSAADPTVSGTFRLTGIDTGTPQRILIIATQTDGSVNTFEQDVSALFANFNPPAAITPLRLTATLSFGIDEISGTINPWKPGWNEGGTGI